MRRGTRVAKVPGDLTCAAHSLILGLIACMHGNFEWFNSIQDVFRKIVREIHDIDGKNLGCVVKPHILRDEIPDFVKEKGPDFFLRFFGHEKWFWDDLVDGNIRGINKLTREKPNERNFMEYANPFFMVSSYLFKCQILVIAKNGSECCYEGAKDGTKDVPIIRIYSDMDVHGGTHFDAMLPDDFDNSWFPSIDNFNEPGPLYTVDGVEYRDIIPRIDLWHSFLGTKYQEVLNKHQQFIADREFAEKLALQESQSASDAELAAKLSAEWNN